MKLSESAQELLELLWIATEEEARAGLAIEDTPLEGVDELIRLGLAKQDDERLALSASGRPEAAQAVRRHRLAERLLVDVLATEEAQVDEHACRFEHVLIDGVDESICTLLGHPRFCPHGKPIPQGECCKHKQESVKRLIAPLCELQPRQQGHIAYIQMNNPKRLQKLMAMGVLPGVPVTLLRRFPSFVLEAGYSQFAVDAEIAADIYVRLTNG
ncbi:MAG: metal-dependent transcriptional regulator [Anaerolineae bacterium]